MNTYADSHSGDYTTDAAGNSQVSMATSLGDYVLARDALPLMVDRVTGGAGASGYNAAMNSVEMTVSGDGDYAIAQTFARHRYLPGRAVQPEFTCINLAPEPGVIKRIGYFSDTTAEPYTGSPDGVYLESSDAGVALCIAKGGNVTRVDRDGWKRSGPNLANFCVFVLDFLYLGGTTVSLHSIYGGARNSLTAYHHAGRVADTIFDHPAQPIRAEIRSTGGAGSFHFCCANVNTMGAGSSGFGTPASIDTGNSYISVATAGTEYALLGVKKNDPTIDLVTRGLSITASAGAYEAYRWRLLMNPTLSSPLAYALQPNIYLDAAVGDGSITVTDPGHVIASGNGAARSGNVAGISEAIRLGQSIAGAYDQMVLAVTPLNSGQKFHAAIAGEVV